MICDLLKFAPGVCSPVTLHSVAAALKHLRFAVRCWSLLTFIGLPRPTIRAPLPHIASWILDIRSPRFRPPSFQGKAFLQLGQTFAKNHPTFCKITDRLLIHKRPKALISWDEQKLMCFWLPWPFSPSCKTCF